MLFERLKLSFCFIILLVGCFLLMVNLYGLNRDIRVDDFSNQYLRFPNDQPANFNDTLLELIRHQNETDIQYSTRVTHVVARGISHVEWFDFPPQQFNQLIPIWENYFLYFMGVFSGIPEYERYHYANYHRSLKRGIGLCGDASMVVSQLLDDQNINNKILTFPGHVVVVATFENGRQFILDADFGVVVPFSVAELSSQSAEIAQLYLDAGYSHSDYQFFNNMYQQAPREWNGVQHFITKKYYFEIFAYWLKWPLPIIMMLFSLVCLTKMKRTKS
ncbi:hypothetical protein [Paraglaciecola hydrolytica]|nr:hypothetical protein [Paraglaciecola hydrolytica]